MSKESRQRAAKEREKELDFHQASDRALSAEKKVATAVALVVLVVYSLTCSRALIGGDSGELTVVALTRGVAHPPGYPLYTMLARAFGFLPFSTYAFRVAFLSSVCGAGAAGLLTAAVTRWAASASAGVLSGLLFAFAPLIWTSSTIAEVFALNNLVLAALLYLSVRFNEQPSEKLLGLAALVFGFGFSNHHTSLFFGTPLLLFCVARLGWKKELLMKVALLFAAGLLPYFYLPIAATNISLLSWGDQTTWSGFWHHITRADYGSLQLAAGDTKNTDFFANLLHFFSLLPRQLLGILWLLPLLGVKTGMTSRTASWQRSLGVFWGAVLAFYLVVFCGLSNLRLSDPVADFILSRFWQAPLFLVCAGIGLAWGGLSGFLGKGLGKSLFAAAGLLAGVLQLGLHYKSQNLSNRDHYDRIFQATLEMLPKETILLTTGDHLVGSLQYQQLFRGIRRDIPVLDQSMLSYPWAKRLVQKNYPSVILPGNGRYRSSDYQLKDFLAANLPKAAVFSLGGTVNWDRDWVSQYESHVYGLTLQFIPKESAFDADAWRTMNENFFKKLELGNLPRAKRGNWDYLLWQQYLEAKRNFAVEMMRVSTRDPRYADWLLEGLLFLEAVVAQRPEPDPVDYKNLGVAYEHLIGKQADAKAKMIQYYRRYIELLDGSDPEMPAIEAAIRRAEH